MICIVTKKFTVMKNLLLPSLHMIKQNINSFNSLVVIYFLWLSNFWTAKFFQKKKMPYLKLQHCVWLYNTPCSALLNDITPQKLLFSIMHYLWFGLADVEVYHTSITTLLAISKGYLKGSFLLLYSSKYRRNRKINIILTNKSTNYSKKVF